MTAHQPHTREGLSSLRTRVARPGAASPVFRLGRNSDASPLGGRYAQSRTVFKPSGGANLISEGCNPRAVPGPSALKAVAGFWVDGAGLGQRARLHRAFDQSQNKRSPALSFHPSRLRLRGNK